MRLFKPREYKTSLEYVPDVRRKGDPTSMSINVRNDGECYIFDFSLKTEEMVHEAELERYRTGIEYNTKERITVPVALVNNPKTKSAMTRFIKKLCREHYRNDLTLVGGDGQSFHIPELTKHLIDEAAGLKPSGYVNPWVRNAVIGTALLMLGSGVGHHTAKSKYEQKIDEMRYIMSQYDDFLPAQKQRSFYWDMKDIGIDTTFSENDKTKAIKSIQKQKMKNAPMLFESEMIRTK